jgi:GGDEF domain-containing protein
MVSIGQSLNDLERAHRAQEAAVECFRAVILSLAQYAVDLEPELTAKHRGQLKELAASLSPTAGVAELTEARNTLRNLLREHRDLASKHLSDLHAELSSKAASLQQIFRAMTEGDGDHEQRLTSTLATLRGMAEDPRSGPLRDALIAASSSLSQSLEELKRHNQLTVAQFLMEIQVLHNRIECLQTAIAIDAPTQLASRQQIEECLQAAFTADAPFSLLLLRTRNLVLLRRQLDEAAMEGLLSAFAKRLRSCLRPEDPAGRWGDDQFVVILEGTQSMARAKARAVSEHCAGIYVCMVEGKPVRPVLHLDVGFVDRGSVDSLDRLVKRAEDFFHPRE